MYKGKTSMGFQMMAEHLKNNPGAKIVVIGKQKETLFDALDLAIQSGCLIPGATNGVSYVYWNKVDTTDIDHPWIYIPDRTCPVSQYYLHWDQLENVVLFASEKAWTPSIVSEGVEE